MSRWPTAHRTLVIILVAGVSLYCGCAAPRPSVPAPPGEVPSAPQIGFKRLPPSNLRVEYLPYGFALTWRTNREPGDPISGYNIYLSPEKSLRGLSFASPEVIKSHWLGTAYPGDTDPRADLERAEISDVQPGVKYFVHVRTAYGDETVGEPSEEITAIPRPFGRIRLVRRFSGEGEGYSFAAQKYVSTQDERNDLYLFVRDDSVFVASPHRLDRYLRYSEFFMIGPSGSIDDFPVWNSPRKGETSILLRQGHTYILSTVEACLAKLRVADIEGSGDGVIVTVDYVYQPRCGEGVF